MGVGSHSGFMPGLLCAACHHASTTGPPGRGGVLGGSRIIAATRELDATGAWVCMLKAIFAALGVVSPPTGRRMTRGELLIHGFFGALDPRP